MINKKKIVSDTVEALRNINREMIVKKTNNKRIEFLKRSGIKYLPLTFAEKKKVDSIYKPFNRRYSYTTHELVKSVTGNFDARVVPENFYRTVIDPCLCEYDIKYFLSDKNYFEVFMPDVIFPSTIIKNVRGVYYDNGFNMISEKAAMKIISNHSQVVIKPSNDSGFGRGIELVNKPDKNTFLNRGEDFVVQKLLKQHDVLAILNASSVNVIRIVTVFVNGKVRPVTSALRIGGVGDFSDNVEHPDGGGMIVVGMTSGGKLKRKGFHSNGTSVEKTPGGVLLENYCIPKYDEMIRIAVKNHERFPQVRFIGWDFTVDDKENVIVMEYNTKSPGILYYQYVNGPLFGDSTEEVFDYVRAHQNRQS